uniref:DUF4794 domain-containing protein n=1 Tax=Anopheles epiroticus TaxID=199890 RepID=A0A182PW27_9DIPT
MALSFISSISLLLVASVLCSSTEAGLAASYLAAPPVAAAYTVAAPIVPAQGVLRTAYSQVVGPDSLPGVFDARNAAAPSAATTLQRAFVTAFGSPEGIRLVGVGAGQAFEGAPTNVEIARAAPGGQMEGAAQQGRSAATPATGRTVPSGPENFGVQQQQQPQQQPTPFNEYGLPVAAGAPVNP